jgi:uncharacterized membrane protein YdjX (TVP38/TMEM64 family)
MLRAALRLLPALVLIVVAVAFVASGAVSDLSLAGLSAHAQAWRAAADADPVRSLGLYMTVYAVVTAAGLPVALALTIAGGVVFGTVEGALAATTAASLAALVGYAAARSALAPLFARWLHASEGRIAALIAELRARGFWPILTCRLAPVLPFALINVASGLARVPVGAYLAATVLGGLPASFIYAGLGAGLGADFSPAALAHAARSPTVLAPLAGLAVLSALPIAVRAWRGRKSREPSVI